MLVLIHAGHAQRSFFLFLKCDDPNMPAFKRMQDMHT